MLDALKQDGVACIYVIENLVDGKKYVGVTTDFEARKKYHLRYRLNAPTKSVLRNAVKKHGPENFDMRVVCIGPVDYCFDMEPRIIDVYGSMVPDGYNICSGGRGSRGLSGAKNGMYGRVGELHPHYGKPGYHRGKKHSPETREKMSAAHKGKKFSPETCEKISENAKKRLDHMAKMRAAAALAREKRKAEGASHA